MNDLTTQDQKPTSPLVAFKRDLARLKDAGELDMLPANVSFEAFKNAAIVAFTDNPMIAKCDMGTVFKSLRRLAAAGLVPDGREAALVPFKTKIGDNYVQVCQAMPMIFGLIKTARNSGEISDIRAHIVYEAEVETKRFNYVVGDTERLEHEPILFGEKGSPVAAYAIASMKDGTIIREFMDAGEIDKVRRSGASQLDFVKGQRPTVSDQPKGIWADWQGEMWKKTVIRRLIKRLPLSAEDMRRVAELDEVRHDLKDVSPDAAPAQRGPNLAQRLQSAPESDVSLDGEVLPPETQDDAPDTAIAHWTDAEVTTGFPGSDAFNQGVAGFKGGVPARACPYAEGTDEANDWLYGWQGQRRASE